MTTPRFDELIHAPTRLSLVAFLAATEWADFAVLRDSVGLSDSALSKQLTTARGRRLYRDPQAHSARAKRPRTSARLPPDGRTAFDRHVLALQEIVAGTAGRWPRPAGQPGSRSAASDDEVAHPGAFYPDHASRASPLKASGKQDAPAHVLVGHGFPSATAAGGGLRGSVAAPRASGFGGDPGGLLAGGRSQSMAAMTGGQGLD